MNKPYKQTARLLPIQPRPIKPPARETPNFADIVQVNAILEKRTSKAKNKTSHNPGDNEHFITLASLRNKTVKFEHPKQEQHHRLDRKNKIQQNAEWMELVKNEENKKNATSKNKTSFQQIKETNRRIEAATKELDFLNSSMVKRRSLPLNKSGSPSTSKLILPATTANSKHKISTGNNQTRKHLCAKGIYPDKMSDINSMSFHYERQNLDNNDKLDEIKSKPSNRKLNALRNKRVDATLNMVDEKLKKVNSKYFNTDYENHLKTLVQKKPKYRSVKDLIKGESDKARLTSMEGSKLIQSELDKEMSIPANKEREYIKQNYQTQVLYENLDFLETQVFHDNFSDEEKKEKNKMNLQKQTPSPRSPRRQPPPDPIYTAPTQVNKYTEIHPTSHAYKTVRKEPPKKVQVKSITKETMTTPPVRTDLETAILKSDYLRREFNVNSTESNFFGSNFMKPDDQCKKQSWSRDIEFLMK